MSRDIHLKGSGDIIRQHIEVFGDANFVLPLPPFAGCAVVAYGHKPDHRLAGAR
jgi:hypothetical protein